MVPMLFEHYQLILSAYLKEEKMAQKDPVLKGLNIKNHIRYIKVAKKVQGIDSAV
jgi:hypothetical protein